jgi:hypothetical protein
MFLGHDLASSPFNTKRRVGTCCGVVCCGVVWCGVVWCGVLCCIVVWCGVVWYVVLCGLFFCCFLLCLCCLDFETNCLFPHVVSSRPLRYEKSPFVFGSMVNQSTCPETLEEWNAVKDKAPQVVTSIPNLSRKPHLTLTLT